MYRGYTEGQLLWRGPEKSGAEDMEIGDGEVVGMWEGDGSKPDRLRESMQPWKVSERVSFSSKTCL